MELVDQRFSALAFADDVHSFKAVQQHNKSFSEDLLVFCYSYSNHIEQAKEQIGREPYPIPTLKHMKTDEFYKSLSEDISLFTHLNPTDFQVENYQSHPSIKAPLSN